MTTTTDTIAVSLAPVAVVAVLRELCGYIDELGSPVEAFTALDLGELADSIEMGDRGAASET